MSLPVPPQNLEAEKAVIGAMLVEPTVIPDVVAFLSPSDFYLDSHRRTFDTILALFNRNEAVDLITVSDVLTKSGLQVSAATIAAMTENALPSHAAAHAQAVKEASRRRALLKVLRQAEEELSSGAEDSLAVAGRLGSTLARLQDGGPMSFVHVGEVVVKTLKQIERAHEARDPVTGIPTGLKDLDRRLGGVHLGELVVIAGRPGMGKTALAGDVAKGAAERGYGVAFVTAETLAPRITQRMISAATGIENRDLRRGLIEDRMFGPIVNMCQVIGKLPLWFLDSDRSWDRIKAKLRSLKIREPGLKLVVIDYVGLLSAPVPGGERYLEIGRISSEAKGMAMDLELGVVLLSQLNREVESRRDKKPQLSDLRESGNLEQDADIVGLLFREAYYNENARPADLAELNIAKNRDGATGIIKLQFNETTVSFDDWTEPSTARDTSGLDSETAHQWEFMKR
jgi:replicative DNA helicase